MREMHVPRGSTVYLGAPAVRMEPTIVLALGDLVDETAGVLEAHLPQAYIPTAMSAPAQVLVIVTEDADAQRGLDQIGAGLRRILPEGRHLDVWPMSPGDPLLGSVRAADCRVSRSQSRGGILRRLFR